MTKSQQVLLYCGVAVLAVIAGLLLRGQLTRDNPQPEAVAGCHK